MNLYSKFQETNERYTTRPKRSVKIAKPTKMKIRLIFCLSETKMSNQEISNGRSDSSWLVQISRKVQHIQQQHTPDKPHTQYKRSHSNVTIEQVLRSSLINTNQTKQC